MLYAGSSWTPFPRTFPPDCDVSSCSSVVYHDNDNDNDNSHLVVIGKTNRQKRHGWSSNGVILSLREGQWQVHATIPGLDMPHHKPLFGTTIHTDTRDTLCPATNTALLVNNRYLYAVVSNDTTDKKIKTNAHGYRPQEELYVADLKDYIMDQHKGLLSSIVNWVGGLCSSRDNNNKLSYSLFWRPVAELENSGSAITGDANLIFSLGGYTPLSPKFYEIFAPKERVSCGARMLRLDHHHHHAHDDHDHDGAAAGWIRLPDMNTRRKNMAAVVAGGFLYALGGQDEHGKPLATVERLDLSTMMMSQNHHHHDHGMMVWEPAPPMMTARYNFSVAAMGDFIFVAGGQGDSGGGVLNSVEYLQQHTANTHDNDEVWKMLPNLLLPRMGASLSIVNNKSKLVIAGGRSSPPGLLMWSGSGALDSIETLDLLVREDDLAAVSSSLATSLPIMASAVVLIDASNNNNNNNFIPPTAPALPLHNNIMVASTPPHQQQQWTLQPSAPSLEDVYHIMEPGLAMATLAPQEERHEEWGQLSPMQPPPLPCAMPPPAAAASVDTKDDYTSSDNDFTCAVCLERKKQVAFYCGHQTCLQCSPLLEECHICRTRIQGRIVLFGD
jgi:Zinc finger, C3HC4 type (RING finger)/Kelch motif